MGTAHSPIYVAVCGPGVATPEEEAWAEEVGRLLARARAVVVCGGVSGVMDAVARGAASEGGASIGILPLGLLFGAMFWRWRNVWPLIVAHTIENIVAFLVAPG